LFSTPGSSTSSEIPDEEQKQMGLNEGLIRFSIGLDNDIKRSYMIIRECMKEVKLI
jgi:methionine-gamma-lyase